jgi:hypothetical protein
MSLKEGEFFERLAIREIALGQTRILTGIIVDPLIYEIYTREVHKHMVLCLRVSNAAIFR